MKNKWGIVLGIAILASLLYFFSKSNHTDNAVQTTKEISVRYGSIEKIITSTGVVQPQNRLEMKPPIAGRIDSILVKEGQEVKIGEVVASMSSTERAALLDATRAKDEKEKKYWEEVYKPIPLIAPISGTVIVSTMQPGQTVTQTDPVIVLSDRLIVQAQVDETDIGRVKEGQEAVITLDAYPEIQVKAKVSHIYYESKIINNVTIYQVDILPQEVPLVFRSGMSANVRIVEESKDNILLVPIEAVKRGKDENTVLIRKGQNEKPIRQQVELGIFDENNIEVVSGLSENQVIVTASQKYSPSKNQRSDATNPFLPSGPSNQRKNRDATSRQ